jgi:glycosyltransferase involved in cell wall biosynthesis
MRIIHSIQKKIKVVLARQHTRCDIYPVILQPIYPVRPKGRVLLSYLEYPLLWSEKNTRFLGHSALWESCAIAKIFQRLGYQVEAINYLDQSFTPKGKYDVVFDIFTNLGRLAPQLGEGTIKLLHCTGSDPYYQNQAELKRVAEVNLRRNGAYQPKRLIANPEMVYKSLESADFCSLIGNDHTRNTYPKRFQQKMELVTVSSSVIGKSVDIVRDIIPPKREFLWFFGGGAVHKGLDLVLEVFSRNPKLILHVVGPVDETDLMEMYRKELTKSKNIHFHGELNPSSQKFQKIINNVFCFVAPTCSESISTAVATCLQLGLYPIISRDTGVTLPEECGIYLETCTIAEIEKNVLEVYEMSPKDLLDQIKRVQVKAFQLYSRKSFSEQMTQYLLKVLNLSGQPEGLN